MVRVFPPRSIGFVRSEWRARVQRLRMTRHAKQRIQQRGIGTAEISIVIAHGDIEVAAWNDCYFRRLSHANVAALINSCKFRIQDIDRAKRLMVLVDAFDQVVTLIKTDPDRRFVGKKYNARR
jgi:Domain of unknown function (DUF4258)